MATNDASGSPAAPPGPGPAALRLDEFPAPSLDKWRSEIERLLRGAPYETRMRTPTPEGLTLEPLYRPEDLPEALDEVPGLPRFARGSDSARPPGGWEIVAEAVGGDPAIVGRDLRADVAGGATAVGLGLAEAGGPGLRVADLGAALAGVDLAATAVHVRGVGDVATARAALGEAARSAGVEPARLRGSLSVDPFAMAGGSGSDSAPTVAFDRVAAAFAGAGPDLPSLAVLRADGVPFHDGGADAVQELGITIAVLVDSLRALDDRGHGPADVAAGTILRFGVGTRLLLEVAKLRAARLLAHRVLEECGVPAARRKLPIHARTSRLTKTLADPHVNLLRTTIEAAAAVFGGADAIHVAPFDEAAVPEGTRASRRLARNVSLVLRHEAHLGRVLDPLGGAWAVERVTADLARAAWDAVQEIERAGGAAAALAKGELQARIAETAAARAEDYRTGKSVLVGTNRYPNGAERLPAPPVGSPPGASIPVRRFGEPFETRRRRMEAHRARGGQARVYLATVGPLASCGPRLDFIASFFEVGGFELVRSGGHETAPAATAAALESGAGVVAIVGPDSAYESLAPAVARALKSARPATVVALAGRPSDEALRAALANAGIDFFLQAGSDIEKCTTKIMTRLGVRS